jgi:hypothetical protein
MIPDLCHVSEIEFMKSHSVPLPSETTLEFGVFRSPRLFGVEELEKGIGVLYIAFVEGEVIREEGVTHTGKPEEVIKFFCRICHRVRFFRRDRYRASVSSPLFSNLQDRLVRDVP